MAKTILDLPDEILESIFSEFDDFSDEKLKKTLFNLTETCKRFYAVIDSSPKLMKLFNLYWETQTDREKEQLAGSKRKFSSICIQNATGFESSFLRFLKNHSSTLTYLDICEFNVLVSEIEALLRAVSGSLEELILNEIKITRDTEVIPIELPKLGFIMYNCGSRDNDVVLFEFFKAAKNVKEFLYTSDNGNNESFDTKNFCELLNNMKDLDYLSFCGNGGSKLFKDDLILDYSSNWKLKNLYVRMNAERDSNRTISSFNLIQFIKSQKYLKTLTLCTTVISADLLNQVLSCTEIENLSICLSEFQIGDGISNVKNTTLKKLSFGAPGNVSGRYLVVKGSEYEQSVCSMLKNCQNLEELKINRIKVTHEISFTINENLNKLQTLIFYDCDFESLYYENVKSMILDLNPDVAINLIRANKQLKYLTLKNNIQSHPMYHVLMQRMNLEKLKFNY